jgi:predicted dinucleotide-binding enzyme
MQIAIIGTGNVGAAIARGLAGKGFGLILGARDPQGAEVRALATATGARVALPKEAPPLARSSCSPCPGPPSRWRCGIWGI